MPLSLARRPRWLCLIIVSLRFTDAIFNDGGICQAMLSLQYCVHAYKSSVIRKKLLLIPKSKFYDLWSTAGSKILQILPYVVDGPGVTRTPLDVCDLASMKLCKFSSTAAWFGKCRPIFLSLSASAASRKQSCS